MEFETCLVNIDIPRTPEYLAINPSGLVPALVYDGHVLTESGLITQFLVDSHPSHLLQSSTDSGGALQRFNIGFFVETYFTKAQHFSDIAVLSSGDEETSSMKQCLDGIINHVEPLLADAAPSFGAMIILHYERYVVVEGFRMRVFYCFKLLTCSCDVGSNRIIPSPSAGATHTRGTITGLFP